MAELNIPKQELTDEDRVPEPAPTTRSGPERVTGIEPA